jgi:DNA-binding transcriptional ArsR family regulator
MKEIEKQMKALANARRLNIIKYLKKTREATVGDIAEEIKLSFKATSKHLGILYAAGVLEKDQRSMAIYYSLAKLQRIPTKQVIATL